MSITIGGLGGFGFESGDPNLRDKIAKLKSKRGAQSGKQRVDEFLEKEMHVDPRELPFGLDGANARMKEMMGSMGAESADLQGNSLGLKAVVFKSDDYPAPKGGCPDCRKTNGEWDEVDPSGGTGMWECYDCEEVKSVPLPDNTIKTVTEKDHGGEDWHDLVRCWVAFKGNLRLPEEDAADHEPHFSFTTLVSWNATTTSAVPVPSPEPDLSKYPTGTVLRIRKATFVDGDVHTDERYVRVGGLFNDNDIVELNTMQPIPEIDLPGWLVVEEL